MEIAEKTRIHPIWLEVAEEIVDRIQNDGYGFLITHDELKEMLEIQIYQDTEVITVKRHNELSREIMNKVIKLRDELLFNHAIYLENKFNKGYVVLEPDEQVSDGYNRIWRKMRKQLKKCINILVHVDDELLSDTAKVNRDRNLNKTVFVLSAANKRKIPKTKKLTEKT